MEPVGYLYEDIMEVDPAVMVYNGYANKHHDEADKGKPEDGLDEFAFLEDGVGQHKERGNAEYVDCNHKKAAKTGQELALTEGNMLYPFGQLPQVVFVGPIGDCGKDCVDCYRASKNGQRADDEAIEHHGRKLFAQRGRQHGEVVAFADEVTAVVDLHRRDGGGEHDGEVDEIASH